MSRAAALFGAVATAALLAGVGTASAQGFANSFYLKGFGGWTIPQNDSFELNDEVTGVSGNSGFDFDSGYILGAAVGYTISPNLSAELEYAFRNADVSLKNLSGQDGTIQSNAWMANVIYTFDGIGTNGAFRPYLGAGLGAADVQFNRDNGADFNGDYNFAYQLITGVAYDVNPSWTINGEVRWMQVNDQDYKNEDFSFKAPFETFDALVGATYHF